MKNLKIGRKLAVGFGVLIAFLCIILAIGIYSQFSSLREARYVVDYQFQRYSTLARIDTDFMDSRRTMNRASLYSSETFDAAAILEHGSEQAARDYVIGGQARHLAILRERLVETFAAGRANLQNDPRLDDETRETDLSALAQLEHLIVNRYIDYYIANTFEAARRGDADGAIAIVRAAAETTLQPVLAVMSAMLTATSDAMKEVGGNLEGATWAMVALLSGIAGVAITAAVVLALYITRLIAKPLMKSSESLRQVSGSLEAAVNQVNDSATTIAEASNQQAAAVEETSATINETSSMIANNAENTRMAAQLAAETAAMAEKGMEEMRGMSQIMDEINESSGTLSKIVKSIDDIAFQTNLLAINATVEAARAGGDAGRSFGVVAEEVRHLAQKSADEAATTTDIIQKDIALANSGRGTSRQVSSSLKGIADKIEQLNKFVAEISAASAEQATGANQISVAMSQIEHSTQSNAATSEESAASAAMLRELVGDLEKACLNVDSVVYGDAGRQVG